MKKRVWSSGENHSRFFLSAQKKGLSAIVATVLIIMIVISALMVLWFFIMPFISDRINAIRVTSVLMNEKISIAYAGQGEYPQLLDVSINRGDTELTKIDIVYVTETVYYEVPISTDIYLLVDLSGSMRYFVPYACMKDGVRLNSPSCYSPISECEITCGGNLEGGYYPLDILIESAHDFVNRILDLNNDAQIALMGFRDSFGGSYQPDYPYLSFTNDSTALNAEIDSWKADAGTYLFTGMKKTYDNFLPRSESEKKILVILGDGDCNEFSCPQSAIDYATNFNDLNITTHTIGFGPDANTALFQGIANNGGGDYHNSSQFEDLAIVFRDIIGKSNITGMVSKEVSVWGVFLDVVVFVGGESESYRIKTDLPGAHEGRRYTLDLEEFTDGWVVEDITKIELYLVGVSEGDMYNSAFMSRYEFD